MNPIALILSALKTWPEPYTLDLEEADPMALAELHSRLTEISQVINDLKKQVAADMGTKLAGRTLRYGQTIFRGIPTKGSAKIKDEGLWWQDVVDGLKATSKPEVLLGALFPASSVRLTALPKLASVLGVEFQELRDKYVTYADSSIPIQVMPVSKAPAYLAKLEDGEIK